MVEWHHRLNGYESEQTLGDSEGQGSLACCSPWGGLSNGTTTTSQEWFKGWAHVLNWDNPGPSLVFIHESGEKTDLSSSVNVV